MKSIYSDLGMSIKLRLYSMQKHHILVVFLCFFCSFFFTTTIGLFGPKMLNSISSNVTGSQISESIVLETPISGRFHQQLWIVGQPVIHGRKEQFTKEFKLSIRLISNEQNSQEYFNRTRYLHCTNELIDFLDLVVNKK
ncbi:unnamed protein product [Brachionus calyciflorus]|uniref:Uncharacterized protein n=1 Tax=Brachionus calyciflorus TaxID=104777 RepID=A0A813M8Z8_9BILA|nr:unnamed protein product [Brachionus calyciflorus]